jgi:hypothetical protein
MMGDAVRLQPQQWINPKLSIERRFFSRFSDALGSVDSFPTPGRAKTWRRRRAVPEARED